MACVPAHVYLRERGRYMREREIERGRRKKERGGQGGGAEVLEAGVVGSPEGAACRVGEVGRLRGGCGSGRNLSGDEWLGPLENRGRILDRGRTRGGRRQQEWRREEDGTSP